MVKNCFPVFLAFFLLACGDTDAGDRKDGYSTKPSTPEDSLFKEVMDGHDEAMARMGKLSGLRKDVEQRLDSVKKLAPSVRQRLEKQYDELRQDLKNAEDGMNRWMDEFQIDSAQDDAERRIEYLTNEKVRVEKVKEDIFSALRKADSTLRR